QVTMFHKPTKRRSWIEPFRRLLWTEIPCDQGLQFLLSLPFLKLADVSQRDGGMCPLPPFRDGINDIAPEMAVDLVAVFGDPAALMSGACHGGNLLRISFGARVFVTPACVMK